MVSQTLIATYIVLLIIYANGVAHCLRGRLFDIHVCSYMSQVHELMYVNNLIPLYSGRFLQQNLICYMNYLFIMGHILPNQQPREQN